MHFNYAKVSLPVKFPRILACILRLLVKFEGFREGGWIISIIFGEKYASS